MRDQAGKILKLTCLLLVALLAYKIARIIPQANPLGGVVIPDLPTLAADKTNSPAPAAEGTNVAVAKASPPATNAPTQPTATTNPPVAKAKSEATNGIPSSLAPPMPPIQSARTVAANSTNNATGATNDIAGTNVSVAVVTTNAGSNLVASANTSTNGTNIAKAKSKRRQNSMMRLAMGNGPAGPVPELPVEIRARVNKVYESEILGEVMHPLPAALQGIAGDVAFLRSANGQTGLVKEGDSLGDLKLLRIGINRVLVEENGQKKELTIFEGYGSKSLMPEEGKVQK